MDDAQLDGRGGRLRELVKRYFELLSGAPESLAAEILTLDFLFHHPPLTPDEGWAGRAVFLERALRVTRTAFPDMAFGVADIVVEGDRAAARWTMIGTHRGEYLGIPASGHLVRVTGMNWFEGREGMLASTHVNRDTWSLVQQISGAPERS
jgi:steroid delta-isomerase-like uncharacterized protein